MKKINTVSMLMGICIGILYAAPPTTPPMDVTVREMNATIAPMNATIAPMNVLVYPINEDTDGDGVTNSEDAFPGDPNEWIDTDGDGIGNNADLDDDGDGISDADEIHYGFDPLDPSDATQDADADGKSNAEEIAAGTNPLGDIEISTLEIEISAGSWQEVALINNGTLIVERDMNQSIKVSKSYGALATRIRSSIDGTKVRLHLNGDLEVITPLADKVTYLLKGNTGEIECQIADAYKPKLLPILTSIQIDLRETTISVPLSANEQIVFERGQ